MTEQPDDPLLAAALAHWGLAGAPCRLVAARENRVFRVDAPEGPRALRLHRPGLRSEAELVSELDWMAALAEGGLTLPRPIAAPDGSLHLSLAGQVADLLTWLPGAPMGAGGSTPAHPAGAYASLGAAMARLHDLSDRWSPPAGFTRHAWDRAGLVGEAPVWGRFWENPLLTADQARRLRDARAAADARLAALEDSLEQGLIHADLVPENVMLHEGQAQLIDFDDAGFGYRLFDLATVLLRAERDGAPADAVIEGYLAERPLDLSELPLFLALRAFTYVGWIAWRLDEPGAAERSARYVATALERADACLI